VPPVPVRKIGSAALVLAAATAIGLALVIPAVERGKSRGEARRAREEAAANAAERARLAADQRVHRAVLPGGRDPIEALERVITADARARDRAGTITGPFLGTRCQPAPPDSARFAASRVYSCFVSTGEGSDLRTGYAFVATIYADGPRAPGASTTRPPTRRAGVAFRRNVPAGWPAASERRPGTSALMERVARAVGGVQNLTPRSLSSR
jgi:hypothetical protein